MKILTIDGGGIRGVYPAHILSRINEELGINFSEYFDLIVGTSTGAIIAAALSIDYPVSKIVKLYKEKGDEIFRKNKFGAFGFLAAKYDNRSLIKELKATFGDKTLSDTSTRLMIPATDIGNGQVYVFKSNYLDEFVRDKNTKILDAVLASCSAPAFFKPHLVKDYLLADGGLWANNPSLAALIETAGKLNGSLQDIKMLSIGTGIGNRYYSVSKPNRLWGLVTGWKGKKLIDMILNLQSKSAQNMVGLMLNRNQYLRINFEKEKPLSLDDIRSVSDLISVADHDFTYNYNNIKDFLETSKHQITRNNETSN